MTYLRTSFGNICQDIAGAESASANKLFVVYSEWCEQYCEYRMSSTKFGMCRCQRGFRGFVQKQAMFIWE